MRIPQRAALLAAANFHGPLTVERALPAQCLLLGNMDAIECETTIRESPGAFVSASRRLVWLAASLFILSAGFANVTAAPSAPVPFDYARPKLITGALYAAGSDTKKVLYTFRRTAVRSGDIVRVKRRFYGANGAVVAGEDIVYRSGRLLSLQMRQYQAHVSGSVRIVSGPKRSARLRLIISYGRGLTPPPKGRVRSLPPDTVVDDTLYPFMLTHWNTLMRGHALKIHFVSLKWKRTFAFRLVRAGETVVHGRTVEQIKMSPVNFLVALFVKPMIFDVSSAAPHRLLSYVGRAMPLIKRGGSWKYLDARTVFHWPSASPVATN